MVAKSSDKSPVKVEESAKVLPPMNASSIELNDNDNEEVMEVDDKGDDVKPCE